MPRPSTPRPTGAQRKINNGEKHVRRDRGCEHTGSYTRGARATIRLNRPKHLNRLQPDDLEALLNLFDRLEADPAVRVLVLTGTGRAFSAGYDLNSVAERSASAPAEQTAGSAFEVVANRLEDLSMPTICRLNGGV